MDRAMRGANAMRGPALARARGRVLEVGFGTGLNLRYYPGAVTDLTALDPLRALRRRVARRVAAAPFPVREVPRAADGRLPFEDEAFDCVVTSWTLCSIADAGAALAEMRRVLRRDGRYLFIEHGLSQDPRVARRQRFWNPLHRRIACGCRLDRPIDRLVAEAGFVLDELVRFVDPQGPRILGEMYQGVARRGA